jgi:hypothetical protein
MADKDLAAECVKKNMVRTVHSRKPETPDPGFLPRCRRGARERAFPTVLGWPGPLSPPHPSLLCTS